MGLRKKERRRERKKEGQKEGRSKDEILFCSDRCSAT